MNSTMLSRLKRSRGGDERGSVSASVVALVTAFLVFAGLLLDGGLALAMKVRALGEAQESARAGAQQIDLAALRATGVIELLPEKAATAAHSHLAVSGHAGAVAVANNTVTVTVTIARPTVLLGLVGVASITVTASGKAEPLTPRT